MTAEPTLPVAPTTATCALPSRPRWSRSIRAWSSTMAAVKALPLVTPMSVRPRSETPPPVTVAVRAPSPTVPHPRPRALSTARCTRSRPSPGSASRWRAPKGTSTTCPTCAPPMWIAAIEIGRHGQAPQRRGIDALGHVAEGSPDAGHVLAEAGARVDGEGEGAGAAHAAKEAARRAGDTARGPAGRHTGGIWVRVPTSRGLRRDLEPQPRCEVGDLAVDRGAHGLGEADVLVDRVDDERAGLAVGLGVELPDEPVVVEDRQRVVAPAALVLGFVHLEDELEAEELLGAHPVVDEPVERAEQRGASLAARAGRGMPGGPATCPAPRRPRRAHRHSPA